MRDTIDFGIDLGTTNSAIAVSDSGAVSIIKNSRSDDCTPSAVWIPRPGVIRVGESARPYVFEDPDNACAEFKQDMGNAAASHSFHKAGLSMTPAMLSAEVLKSLRENAALQLRELPDAAVITVPAAFALNQTNATSEAARLAGFTADCPLVQEPTAAAFAYGMADASERARWMVFDLGGGTFDAAIVSKRDGEMQVIHHAGDPYLGGKLIDWAIVDELLVPAVRQEFGIPDLDRKDDRWRVLAGRLKGKAEEAKIDLSTTETAWFELNIPVGGGVEPFEYTLNRADVERLAHPFYARAIQLCRNALAEGGLGVADVDKLLLVGGPTLTPSLRELLADPREGLGIPLDHSQDPSTVVARGAAVFASRQRLNRPLPAPKAGEFTVDLMYDPVVSTLRPTVAGRLHGTGSVDWSRYSVVIGSTDQQNAFESGRLQVSPDGGFLAEVVVRPETTTRFSVTLTDAGGRRQILAPSAFTLAHDSGPEFGGAVLAEALSIAKVDDTAFMMLRKGVRLPAEYTHTFVTTAGVFRSDPSSSVIIPILQGDRKRADRNLTVGTVYVRPADVRRDIPVGTEIEVTIAVDRSSLVQVTAEIPLADTQVEATLDMNDVRPPDAGALAGMFAEVKQRDAELRSRAQATDAPEALGHFAQLDKEKAIDTAGGQVAAARSDTGAASAAERSLRDLEARLDDISEALEKPAIFQELEGILHECEQAVQQSGTAEERRELNDLRTEAQRAIANRDTVAARALQERAQALLISVMRRSPTFDLEIFFALRQMRDHMTNQRRADTLVAQGERAIAANDYRALPGIVAELGQLLPPSLVGKVTSGPPPRAPGHVAEKS